MLQELEEAFRPYTDVVQERLAKFHEDSQVRRNLMLVKNTAWLQDEVNRLEDESDFRRVVETTYAAFWNQEHYDSSLCEYAVKNFFRRSNYYLEVAEGKCPSHDIIFDTYTRSFQRTETKIRYLAPMEFVQFAKSYMDFEKFHIRRFTKDELATLFQQRVNKVFYPSAIVDETKLAEYWFIDVSDKSTKWSPPFSFPNIDWFRANRIEMEYNRIEMKYTRYNKVIEPVLQHLALFDWETDILQDDDDLKTVWYGFNIPFVLTVDDDLLVSPMRTPDLSRLTTEPRCDSQTGEEIGEFPQVRIYLNDNETTAFFEEFIRHAGTLLSNVKGNRWLFLKVALDFLMKAFFSEGLEQLLWHITTLEALFGKDENDLTGKLAQRIASIMRNQDDKDQIVQRFKDLYGFRCNLVHGNIEVRKGKVYTGHLRQARQLARVALLWFLEFLNHVQTHYAND